MASYRPIDMSAYMETAVDPLGLRLIYQGHHVCIENAFSDATMAALHTSLRTHNYLVDINVETGGGIGGVKFPTINCERGNNVRLAQIGSSNQFKLSATIGGLNALNEVRAYMERRENADLLVGRKHGLPSKVNEVNVNLSNFMWRYTHRDPVTLMFPLIPHTLEISHLAEGYSKAHPTWGKAKVELTQMESAEVNESRKFCTTFGLMWRKPDDSVIPAQQQDTYSGATLCPHAACGSPCYAPYPTAWKQPTGATVNLRKRERRDGGGKGRKLEFV